jgi:predicted transposase YdaD
MLDEKTEAEEEERELIMNLSPAYLKWKEETINEGIQLGKLETVPILAELGLSVADSAQRLGFPEQLVSEMLTRQG